ncbi:Cell division protein SepF [bioreactor metagenome]|uniref:Cell division protein SepF n=1 Tax=bioreactor metagenome TaxID=1076179 RepID=A0A645IWE7_9ZZZZ|nr:cell division protein SepF [Candidatus Pelethousia sp.]
MAGILNKLMDFIGIEETEMDDDLYGEEYFNDAQAQTESVLSMANRSKRQRPAASPSSSNVVSLPTAASMKMIVYHPISYEDTQNIIDNLKSRKPVIVNMEELEIDCAQRILDFMAGAIYALNGTIYKISRGIFVVAPTNYDIIGNDDSAEYVDVI